MPTVFGRGASSLPAAARTASTQAATRASCTCRTATRARYRCSPSPPARSIANGACPAAAVPTWAASPPTDACCGSPADTTPRCTRSTLAPAGSSDRSPWEADRTACPSIPSRPATHSATPVCSAEPGRTAASGCAGRLLPQDPRQSELREYAAAAEPGDRGDPVAVEGEDEQRVRPRDVGLGDGDVASERWLGVGARWHEPQPAAADLAAA